MVRDDRLLLGFASGDCGKRRNGKVPPALSHLTDWNRNTFLLLIAGHLSCHYTIISRARSLDEFETAGAAGGQ